MTHNTLTPDPNKRSLFTQLFLRNYEPGTIFWVNRPRKRVTYDLIGHVLDENGNVLIVAYEYGKEPFRKPVVLKDDVPHDKCYVFRNRDEYFTTPW